MAVVSTVVVKVGGEVLEGEALGVLAADVAELATGGRVAIVHGGGAQATAMQRQLGIAVNKVGGRRITDEAALDVMKRVLRKLNVDLCNALSAVGAKPAGIDGTGTSAIRAVRRPPRVVTGCGPDPVDFGEVGDVTGFNTELLEGLFASGHIPVLACLGGDDAGRVYNINADIVANQLAATLEASHLFLLTSVPGVLRDVGDPSSRIPQLTAAQARKAIEDGTISGGMIPKVEESLRVLESGVGAIHILGNLTAGDLARAVESSGRRGTTLTA